MGFYRENEMEKHELIKTIKERLSLVFGKRFKGIVIYGSFARGDERPDSDIDVLVLLDEIYDLGEDLKKSISSIYRLSLDLDRRISVKPVSVHEYENKDCPLYRHAHTEGIVA